MVRKLYELHVNGERFQVPMNELLGLQIRALAAVDPIYDLVLEGQGAAPDRILSDNDAVSLADSPVHIFTRPPTTFGSSSEGA